MPHIDLDGLSPEQLDEVIKKASQKKEQALQYKQDQVKRQVLELVQKAGFELHDLFPLKKGLTVTSDGQTQPKPKATRKGAIPAKFHNPDNPFQTWSGRGHRPSWFKDQLAKGRKEKDLLIR